MRSHRVLGGLYEIGDVLGRGGMADVHLGRDLRSGRSVAVKVLRADLARDPMFRARFRREAQALASVDDPAVVSLYDDGWSRDAVGGAHEAGAPFLVMEYVAGRSLRERLDAGGLTTREAVRYQLGVLTALDVIHRAGLIHRDIKPANVMVTPDGAVKVVDFGIARALDDPDATMTRTHAVLGTAQYLSPEQVRGEIADVRSDLYSAGCLLYELLAGRPPFLGDNPVSVAYQHVYSEPVRVSGHGPDAAFDAVLLRALAKDRHDRFQTARAFSRALWSATTALGHDGDGRHPHEGAGPRRSARAGRAVSLTGPEVSGSLIFSPDPGREAAHTRTGPGERTFALASRKDKEWATSPSGTRTATRSRSTTRTRARGAPSSSSTGTR